MLAKSICVGLMAGSLWPLAAVGQARDESSSVALSESPFQQAALQAVSSFKDGRDFRLDVALPDNWAAPSLPTSAYAVKAKAPESGQWRSRMSLWMDILVSGQVLRSVLVPIELKAWTPAWVAKTDMPAGTPLSPQWLEATDVDVAVDGRLPWRGQPAGQVLQAPVRSGQHLSARQVAPSREVQQGSEVSLVLRSGAVEIRAPALALQGGNAGQVIQVRMAESKALLSARVIGPQQAEWTP